MQSLIVGDIHRGNVDKDSKLCSKATSLLGQVLHRANSSNVGQLVLLGDYCEARNSEADYKNVSEVIDLVKTFGFHSSFVLGNHEDKNLDQKSKAELFKIKSNYYSFDRDGIHFVILDPEQVSKNPYKIEISMEQRNWLKKDLRQSQNPSIIFCHESLSDQPCVKNLRYRNYGEWAHVDNRAEIRKILRENGNVLAVIQGHMHWNNVSMHDGITYFTLQSLIEQVKSNRPAGAYCYLEVKPNGSLDFRIFGKDLKLITSDVPSNINTVFDFDSFQADFNEKAVKEINTIISIDRIEKSSASGYLPDYDQLQGSVVSYNLINNTPKKETLDYFKQGLIFDTDINKVYRQICARASLELKKRGLLQIDYLEGDPYLRIYSNNSIIANSLMPLIKGYKLEQIAKLMGFRHLKTFTLSTNVTIHNGNPETLKSALFMKI